MVSRRLARCLVGLALPGLVGAFVAVPASPAFAAVTCPAVSGSGTVTPAPTPGVNWSGCDLSLARFVNVDMTGVDLSGATLHLAVFLQVNLTSADLTNSDLSQSSLSGVQLGGALLAGADLTGAQSGGLTGPEHGGITGTPASLPANWSLTDGFLVGPGASLPGADFSGVSLAHADLAGAYLDGVRLTGTDLTGANLAGATLTMIASGGITGTPSALPVGWSVNGGYLIGPGADLAGANLAGLSLSGADLTGTVLTSADLNGTDLGAASLANVKSGGITGTPSQLPAGWLLIIGYLIGPGADLNGAGLGGVDLSGASLQNANLGVADLTAANLAGVNLTGANLDGADLTGADLTGADLAGADLATAVLASTNLSGASLANANLLRIRSGGITGTPASLPKPWAIASGYLIGPWDNLAGADLGGADLTGANLTYSYLDGADLDNANLNDANLESAILLGASVTGVSTVGTNWFNTTCPDGTNSDRYVDGCFSPVDTTPPVVSVVGVTPGQRLILGTVPLILCRTSDDSGHYTNATLTVTTTGANGVGPFTATCSGAVDLAGNKAAPVSVHYSVVYGFAGYLAPASGSDIARAQRTFVVKFRLGNANDQLLSPGIAAALAAAHQVKVTLTGPRIRPEAVLCSWHDAAALNGYFTCSVKIPSGVLTGRRYHITARENVGSGFVTAPAINATAGNPQIVHFR